jgi:hypothetical protein
MEPVQVIVTLPLYSEAVTPEGAAGVPSGVTELDGAEYPEVCP